MSSKYLACHVTSALYYTGQPADIVLGQYFAEHLASYNSGTTLIHAPKFLD